MLEGGAVAGFAFSPGPVDDREEILFPEVLDEGDIAAGIVVEDLRDVDSGLLEKTGHGEEVAIVLAIEGVVNPDEGRMIFRLEADDGAPRSAPLDGFENYGVVGVELQVGTNRGEEGVGSHGLVIGGQLAICRLDGGGMSVGKRH